MEKRICDVCGTSYPEASVQCPICGYARPSAAKSAQGGSSYQYVKGGRFSSANVRKRNEEKGIPVQAPVQPEQPKQKKKRTGQNSNFVFGVVAIILLFVLIAVLVFFIFKIIDRRSNGSVDGNGSKGSVSDNLDPDSEKDPNSSNQAPDDNKTQEPDFVLETDHVELTALDQQWIINFTSPPNIDLKYVTFTSEDPAIATVDNETGTITAVSPGETRIKVEYSETTEYITVVCEFELVKWGINKTEFSLFYSGHSHDLLMSGSTVDRKDIAWYSDNENVATVVDGYVTAVYGGKTTIYAEYAGEQYKCIVECKFEPKAVDVVEIPLDVESLHISHKDVSLWTEGQGLEKSFTLVVVDKNGTVAEVQWTSSKEGVVTIEGNKITANAVGYTIVQCVYEGQTYACEIRVHAGKKG